MINKMMKRLLDEGLSRKLVGSLDESQITVLYKKMVKEQKTEDLANKVTAAAQKAREELKTVEDQMNALVGEDELDDKDALGAMAMQGDTGQEIPHDSDDMAPDGMDDDSDNNRKMMQDSELAEKAKSKKQQRFMGMVHALKKGELEPSEVSSEVKTAAKGMTKKEAEKFASTKHKGLPNKVKTESKEDKIRQIEETLVYLVEKHISEMITKEDLLGMVEADTKEAPTKTPTKTPSKPDRKTPYQPKHQPKPKAKMPKELSFDELNIQFRDGKKD